MAADAPGWALVELRDDPDAPSSSVTDLSLVGKPLRSLRQARACTRLRVRACALTEQPAARLAAEGGQAGWRAGAHRSLVL